MHRAFRLIPLVLAFAAGSASADGSGTFYSDGTAHALKSAYAFRMADPFDKGKQITRVVFSDRDIDAAALNDARDRDSAIGEQLRGATTIELNIEADGSVQNVNSRLGDTFGSQSGSGWYTLTLRHNDDRRVEGRFVSNDEADKESGRFYDLTFAFDLPGAPDLGTALPPGGGDAGKAYLAHLAALKKGDVDALARTMSKQRAGELLAHRNDADFKMLFGFIRSQALQDPKYVSGHVKGDDATLEYTGKGEGGSAKTTTVTMVREGGAWKVAKESSSTSMN
jgi:hypothetical protein